ncbi:YhjD/YihY/BrkB family envelope integrity protein, partial [Lactococcus cremoris]
PFLHINTTALLSFLSEQLPSDVYKGIEPVINNLLNQRNTGLLSLSVLAGFWTFSRALSALQMSMNKAYEVFNHRDFIVSRI